MKKKKIGLFFLSTSQIYVFLLLEHLATQQYVRSGVPGSRSLTPTVNRRLLRIASSYSRGLRDRRAFSSSQETVQTATGRTYLGRIGSTWAFSLSKSPQSKNTSIAPHFRFVAPCAAAHGVRERCLTFHISRVHPVVLPPCSQETLVDELVEFFTACHLRGVRSVAGECEL